jgi:serine/threonine protein kinase
MKGAFGEVRLCTHRKTGVKRAVKIIKKSFLRGKEETRFLSEIEILKTMVIIPLILMKI